jgi:hypothetical protein
MSKQLVYLQNGFLLNAKKANLSQYGIRVNIAKNTFTGVGFNAWAFPKNSNLLVRINEMIVWLLSTGVVDHAIIVERRRAFPKSRIFQEQTVENDAKVLSIEEFLGAFVLLGAGITISIIVFILELMQKCNVN